MRRARALTALTLAVLAAAPAAAAGAPSRANLVQGPVAPAAEVAVAPGDPLAVQEAVANRGRARAPATRTRFAILRGAVSVALGERRARRLRPGAADRATTTLVVPATVAPGVWALRVCADTAGRVRERSERDNCRIAPGRLVVRAPPPARAPVPSAPAVVVAPAPLLPEPEPEPEGDGLVRVRECGLPLATSADEPERFDARWATSTGPGWTGGDGSRSVALPDGRVAWFFNDSFLGPVRDGTFRPLVHNALVVQDGDCRTTVVGGTAAAPADWLAAGGDGDRRWFWFGQPYLDGDVLRLPLSRVRRTGPGGWDFAGDGSALATLSLPDLAVVDVTELPEPPRVGWGAATLARPGVTYLFGTDDGGWVKELHVARAPAGRADGPWEVWDGAGWTTDVAASAPLLTGVSSAFSVIEEGDGVALVSQGVFSPHVDVRRAPAPEGPYDEPRRVATIPDPPRAYTYNAVLHPEFTAGDDLLLSYDVMPVATADLNGRPELYRPRFLRVTLPGATAPEPEPVPAPAPGDP